MTGRGPFRSLPKVRGAENPGASSASLGFIRTTSICTYFLYTKKCVVVGVTTYDVVVPRRRSFGASSYLPRGDHRDKTNTWSRIHFRRCVCVCVQYVWCHIMPLVRLRGRNQKLETTPKRYGRQDPLIQRTYVDVSYHQARRPRRSDQNTRLIALSPASSRVRPHRDGKRGDRRVWPRVRRGPRPRGRERRSIETKRIREKGREGNEKGNEAFTSLLLVVHLYAKAYRWDISAQCGGSNDASSRALSTSWVFGEGRVAFSVRCVSSLICMLIPFIPHVALSQVRGREGSRKEGRMSGRYPRVGCFTGPLGGIYILLS